MRTIKKVQPKEQYSDPVSHWYPIEEKQQEWIYIVDIQIFIKVTLTVGVVRLEAIFCRNGYCCPVIKAG